VARGDLDRLARSVVRLAQRSWCCRWSRAKPANARCQRIGPALLFERLCIWHMYRAGAPVVREASRRPAV